MTDLRVLQEGRVRRAAREAERRRRLRRRRLRRLLFLGVLVLAVLLAALASATNRGTPHPAAIHPLPKPAHHSAHPAYATQRAPVQIRRPGLKLALRSGLLFDVRTGRVLWQRNPTEPLPIASLTKMMTALVVAEHSKATDRVMITRQAKNFSGSGVGLLPLGKRVSELALLYGLLLPSGNDAAIALAQHVSGSQTRFVELMNRTAAHLGLSCTHFATVSGIEDRENYSCATDLAVLAHAVLVHPLLRHIVASRSAILPFPIKGGRLFLYNNNPLLIERYPGADGIKTGYTQAAGLCLVATARHGRRWLGVVLLHSANWTTQAATLLDDGFAALTPPQSARPRPRRPKRRTRATR